MKSLRMVLLLAVFSGLGPSVGFAAGVVLAWLALVSLVVICHFAAWVFLVIALFFTPPIALGAFIAHEAWTSR